MVKLDKNRILEIIINPSTISLEETISIGNLVKEYPYFQIARVVELIGLKKHNSLKFNKSLKKCALFSSNRTILRDIIEFDKIIYKKKKEFKKEIIISNKKTENTFINWLNQINSVSESKENLNNSLINKFIELKPSKIKVNIHKWRKVIKSLKVTHFTNVSLIILTYCKEV